MAKFIYLGDIFTDVTKSLSQVYYQCISNMCMKK